MSEPFSDGLLGPPGSAHCACMSLEFGNKPGQRYRMIIQKILRNTNHNILLYGYHCDCCYLMI